jgi:alkylation response protein AidB-like acyl-CoA dehydrogenase
VARDAAGLEAQASNDGSQRLFRVTFEASEATRLAEGEAAQSLVDAALDRGALFSAAQALGAADRLIALAAEYAGQRVQFGVAIGTFQAVKHMLADEKVKLEYARSHVYRAAHSVAHAVPCRAADVSMAKLAACEAATQAAKTSLQVHGAIGYTYEQDVHIWMKRAWSLDLAYGDSVFHRARLCDAVIDGALPAESFGYSPRGA